MDGFDIRLIEIHGISRFSRCIFRIAMAAILMPALMQNNILNPIISNCHRGLLAE